MRIILGAVSGLGSRFIVLGGVIVSSALAISFAGCSGATSSSSGTDAGGGGTDSGSSSDSGGAGDGSSGQDTGSSGGDAGVDSGSDPDQACYAMSANRCAQCCSNNHSAGDQVYNNALDTCICDQAHCGTQCAQTDCSNAADAGSSQPGDPCDLCQNALLADGGACAIAIDNACNANADCKAFVHCSDKCP